mmetsp:Transcript_50486/g.114360  ORF Transcript_50486/g.114360 Transcript_50486/m.114360 type:complete len:200 (+) Transcript_50486:291-890(+)
MQVNPRRVMELKDHLLELLQGGAELVAPHLRQDGPFAPLDVHLHDQAAVRHIEEAGLLQKLIEGPALVDVEIGGVASQAELVEAALGALLRCPVHCAIELVHRDSEHLVHVGRPFVVPLHSYGERAADAISGQPVRAHQIASVAVLAQSHEAVAAPAYLEAAQEVQRDAVGGNGRTEPLAAGARETLAAVEHGGKQHRE